MVYMFCACLSNYLLRDECVTHLMDEENSVHFVYLDIAKMFDPCYICLVRTAVVRKKGSNNY